MQSASALQNVLIGKNCSISENAKICPNCIIGDNVILEDGVYIDYNSIIRNDVHLGRGTYIGANCILGEYQMDFFDHYQSIPHCLQIGSDAIIRSNTIIYSGSTIGNSFQTGHHVTVRENTKIGMHVSVGSFSDIQGDCQIGNYVRFHSNVFVGKLSKIDSFVWIFPHVVLTNDPTPPSNEHLGIHVNSYAIIAANATILPGIDIGSDSLVGAGAVVTKNVEEYSAVVGNPANKLSDVRNIKNKITGENAYPWRYHFNRAMPWEKIGFDTWYAELNMQEK